MSYNRYWLRDDLSHIQLITQHFVYDDRFLTRENMKLAAREINFYATTTTFSFISAQSKNM